MQILGDTWHHWAFLLKFGMLYNTYFRRWGEVNLVFNSLCDEATDLAVAWSGRKSSRFSI